MRAIPSTLILIGTNVNKLTRDLHSPKVIKLNLETNRMEDSARDKRKRSVYPS